MVKIKTIVFNKAFLHLREGWKVCYDNDFIIVKFTKIYDYDLFLEIYREIGDPEYGRMF